MFGVSTFLPDLLSDVYCLLLLKRSPVRSFISRFVLLLLTTDWSSRSSLSSFLRIVTHFALRLLRSFSSSGSYSHVSTFFLLTDLHLSSFQSQIHDRYIFPRRGCRSRVARRADQLGQKVAFFWVRLHHLCFLILSSKLLIILFP
jgi:hypothetical protein